MSLLALSIAFLAVSPFIYRLCLKSEPLVSALDGFIFVSMAGLILGDVLPHTVRDGGAISFLFALVGFMGPTLMERSFHRAGHEAHLAALVLGLAGLCLHGAMDGVFLVAAPSSVGAVGHTHLPLAVVLHRLPDGLTIWWLVSRNYGAPAAVTSLVLAAVSTIVGYAAGPEILEEFSGRGTAWFQALVAGSLLHVVHHRPHVDAHCCVHEGHMTGRGLHEGLGGLVGVILLALLIGESVAHEGSLSAEIDHPVGQEALHTGHNAASAFTERFLALALASSSPLLLAYVMAGFLATFLPAWSIRWLSRGARWKQAFRGMGLGLPIPVCSCGVVPLYRSLVQRGAPTTAAMAFLVATPELGVDAVLLSIPLLGMPFTVLRVVAAALVALATGWIVGSMATRRHSQSAAHEAPSDPVSPLSAGARVKSALAQGFGEVVDHTGPWIILGLVVAALAGELMEGSWLTSMHPWIEVPVFALIGVPVYVCASGATPLVAVLLAGGISPGAALAFLLTGPATNVTTFGVLAKLHGWRIALAFCLVMTGLAVGLGVATNELFRSLIPPPTEAPSPESVSPFQAVALVLLAIIFLISFVRRGPRQFAAEILSPHREG